MSEFKLDDATRFFFSVTKPWEVYDAQRGRWCPVSPRDEETVVAWEACMAWHAKLDELKESGELDQVLADDKKVRDSDPGPTFDGSLFAAVCRMRDEDCFARRSSWAYAEGHIAIDQVPGGTLHALLHVTLDDEYTFSPTIEDILATDWVTF